MSGSRRTRGVELVLSIRKWTALIHLHGDKLGCISELVDGSG